VVVGASFYIEHDIDYGPLRPGAWLDKPFTVIVPIVVLDEVGDLK
jgi:hypothetical protein